MNRILSLLALLIIAGNCYAQSCASTINLQQQTANLPNSQSLLQVNLTLGYPNPANGQLTNDIYWGDGTALTNHFAYTATHTYATAGTYTVTVVSTYTDTSTNTINCMDSSTGSITISTLPCMTNFNHSVNSQNNGNVSFTANNVLNTSNLTYTWFYGDGGSDTSTNNTASHTYAQSGQYVVTLIVSNGSCTFTTFDTVYVFNGCGVASFNSFPATSNTSRYWFINTSTFKNNSQLVTFEWDFGDGTTSTTSPLSFYHDYATPGHHYVTMIATWHDTANNQVLCKDTTRTIIWTQLYATNNKNIYGYIYKDSTNPVISPTYKVWLIKYNTNAQTLKAVDSQIVSNTYNYMTTYYLFDNISTPFPGNFLVKAAVINGPTSGSGYVPTYSDSALMWNTAINIPDTGTYLPRADILMKYGTVTSGPGFVGGKISQGANKGTANGIPDMNVFIIDANGNLMQNAVTDASGNYSFSQLPNGTYTIYPEQMEFITTPSTITISNNQTTINNINFERSITMKTITPKATGVTNINADDNWFSIHPNPTQKYVIVNWQNTDQTNATGTLKITDITGRAVYTNTVLANRPIQIQLDHINSGVYFVTIDANNSRQTQKLIIQ